MDLFYQSGIGLDVQAIQLVHNQTVSFIPLAILLVSNIPSLDQTLSGGKRNFAAKVLPKHLEKNRSRTPLLPLHCESQ